MIKLYVTGGIFNHAERRELDEIAHYLELAGVNTYVPHRDGFEFVKLKPLFQRMGYSPEQAEMLLGKIIFCNDIFQVIALDGVVFNMNGRVPDDGATVEITTTWMAGNFTCIYKDDCRCLMEGIDNPLIDGLVDFTKVNDKEKIPGVVQDWFLTHKPYSYDEKIARLPERVKETFHQGEAFDQLRKQAATLEVIAEQAVALFSDSIASA